MPKRSLNPGKNEPNVEKLNRAIEAMFARADSKAPRVEGEIEPLLRIAANLRDLPRESFKIKLKSELKGETHMATVAEPVTVVHAKAAPRIAFKSVAKAIEFYKKALGAQEKFRFEVEGKIPHAEIIIGDSSIMLADEWPEGGRFSAETWGHSPVAISLDVDDVDAVAARAEAAGMKVVSPPTDQFYGRRDATLIDPFGYTWNISTVKEEMSLEEMHRRMKKLTEGPEGGDLPKKPALNPVPRGFSTLTPYIVAQDADSVIDFVKKTFGGEELFRTVGSAGGYHCEVRVDDSMVMIGGGGPGLAWKGESMLGAFHVYVRDCDAAYERALATGGKSLDKPADQDYGERSASVIDPAGNHWYIATFKETGYKWEGSPTIQPYLHPLRAEPVISFLKRAFGAEELGRYASPDGVMHHATLKMGTSHLEMGEAHGPYQPMKSMFYLYVPQVDAVYRTAIAAGAKSIHEPADQPYGDRVGAVTDAFGNQWWIASHIKDVAH